MLEFTSKELNKIQILTQEIDPDNFEDKGLADTRASRMPAFFETSSVNLPQYA